MARKKGVHCGICGKRGVTKQTHCNICYKNNADNCHHSKAKGMCPFEEDNNNYYFNSINDNDSNVNNINEINEKDNDVNNKIDKHIYSNKETHVIASHEKELIIPSDNNSTCWG